jgi:cytochrome c-type biogenesis protein CcmH
MIARGAAMLAMLIALSLVGLSVLCGFSAYASDAVPTEKDPVTAARAVKLAEKLRCLVCQNQSIADSNADLAKDLRQQISEQIAAGKTDAQILDYMTARYGDFVLYQPPIKTTTVLLWSGPALLLIAGLMMLVRFVRRRRDATDAPVLSADDHARAARLLAGGPGDEKL